ncbi:MAG: hypothetical protein O6757_10300, partial [Alphaproteobacteria bacterium]|nr:hypothetical protein [Alphaproteobacteria bacterium]
MAVLQRAIIDAFTDPGKGGATMRDAAEAQRWLTRGGDDLALACEAINIDPGMVETWGADMAEFCSLSSRRLTIGTLSLDNNTPRLDNNPKSTLQYPKPRCAVGIGPLKNVAETRG